jgi:hypothetical protein
MVPVLVLLVLVDKVEIETEVLLMVREDLLV